MTLQFKQNFLLLFYCVVNMIVSWKGKFLVSVNQNHPQKLFGTNQITSHLQTVFLFFMWIPKSLLCHTKCFAVCCITKSLSYLLQDSNSLPIHFYPLSPSPPNDLEFSKYGILCPWPSKYDSPCLGYLILVSLYLVKSPYWLRLLSARVPYPNLRPQWFVWVFFNFPESGMWLLPF